MEIFTHPRHFPFSNHEVYDANAFQFHGPNTDISDWGLRQRLAYLIARHTSHAIFLGVTWNFIPHLQSGSGSKGTK